MKRALIAAALLLTLGACGGGRPDAAARSIPAPSPSPSRTDPGVTGCRALQGVGTAGTAEGYRHIAAVTAGTGDARLGAAAVALYSATGPALDGAGTRLQRLGMLDAVLDLAEECIRVLG